ncbi:glutamate--tRNA ligase [Marinoscillum furvescens]|uniref:Glutamate--tRNA ligase n=1 Tax=Marinoscillum furvescens DSM 4134 TaxID=1122208 RepID=A0A3D9LII3_MARFU|nr:glutamate--tRNA ligase [Marinoscillum furvescens]REE05839.1 glutamyl-tRNA synthetase [Marinoscillum furvescens DSM 4134]
MDQVRVRFAPSPTGALHIGGVRTALFNYLFAKKNNGTFILRIEDTDQTRFVEGAEAYIKESLEWCGIEPDESPWKPGDFGPYHQSQRKEIYQKYAQKLLDEGNAYYAFDTPEELDVMRERLKEAGVANPQYNAAARMTMKNSLTLSAEEVQAKMDAGEPYVVRFKVDPKEEVRLNDMIRGWVHVHGSTLDDKVLMKSDGLPTYHLANIVDDHLMKITHVIRGEEWLPSAPLHVLLYKYLGFEETMPQFAHLPLILKPDGNGKLSKRAADKAGFPIFPLNWNDPESGELSVGFREEGFLPDALINFLAFLGWNPGTEQELFSREELIQAFGIEKVNKAGTKFDVEKAKWFNQQYLKSTDPNQLAETVKNDLHAKYQIECSETTALAIVDLLKERVTFPHEMAPNALYLFYAPEEYDEKVVRKKWNEEAEKAVTLYANALEHQDEISPEGAKDLFFTTMEANDIKAGKNMQALRMVVTGEGSGPDLMAIISLMGGKAVAERIKYSIDQLK